MFLHSKVGAFIGDRGFHLEIPQILLFEEKEHLIIYDDIVSERIGNFFNDILLVVTCIEHYWTGQIGKEKLF
jgi:hypothetical protein